MPVTGVTVTQIAGTDANVNIGETIGDTICGIDII